MAIIAYFMYHKLKNFNSNFSFKDVLINIVLRYDLRESVQQFKNYLFFQFLKEYEHLLPQI